MTLYEIIESSRKRFNCVEVHYLHPLLYIVVVDEMFSGFSEDARELNFIEGIDGAQDEIERLRSLVGLTIVLLAPHERAGALEFLQGSNTPHWLSILGGSTKTQAGHAESKPVPLHFYGFKGGQGRSTVLALLAKSLAQDGFKVLAIDADLEAPSLDLLFAIAAPEVDSTLMGLCGWSDAFQPLPASRQAGSRGLVDIVPCRPREQIYDMDYSAFVVRTAIDLNLLSRGMERLRAFLNSTEAEKYDVILFDHRTGVASSVLPIIESWRGPAVICARPDGISRQALSMFSSLFSQNPENPGAYLSFSLSETVDENDISDSQAVEIQMLLERLSAAIATGAEGSGEPLPPDAMQRYWITWNADKAIYRAVCPDTSQLRASNLAALSQLREVLGLSFLPFEESKIEEIVGERSPSGAVDSGWFIETSEISKLLVQQSPFTYIVGRKGTGKTRLHREMVSRNLAEPLLSSADFTGGGLASQTAPFSGLLAACENNYGRFWWALTSVAMAVNDTSNVAEFEAELDKVLALSPSKLEAYVNPYAVGKRLRSDGKRRYFAIDGVETAVPSSALRPFVEQLLLFALAVQSDSKLSRVMQLRIFLRSDLLQGASQNIEQQTNGRTLELQWNRDSIYNFVLSRIELHDWFKENFGEAYEEITSHRRLIRAGGLSQSAYERLLLQIFPTKLRRNNLQTLTFFDTYFSDTGGSAGGASFYPRLFDSFLNEVTQVAATKDKKGQSSIEAGRVAHGVVLDAHENASSAFLNEVKQELYNLVDFSPDVQQNNRIVDSLLDALDGKQTPFKLDDLVKQISAQLTDITDIGSGKLREALKSMQELGLFENRSGYPGEWRAGRLYKQALRMKYVR